MAQIAHQLLMGYNRELVVMVVIPCIVVSDNGCILIQDPSVQALQLPLVENIHLCPRCDLSAQFGSRVPFKVVSRDNADC